MKTITQSIEIEAPASAVWLALTDPNQTKKWTGESAIMSQAENSKFSL